MPSSYTKIIYMKLFNALLTAACCIISTGIHAQNDIPKGFSKGNITLPGNTIVAGYVKDNLHSNGTISIITDGNDRRKNYSANEIMAALIDSTRFICIKGDFFRVISEGELYFLQKASNASNQPIYNGAEAIFIKGTEGRVNDYFFYDNRLGQLKLLTKKNRNEMIAGTFNNCAAAIARAGEAGEDLAQLRQAVDIYNQRSQK